MPKKEIAESCKFTKIQLLNSAIFNNRKDALGVVIQEGEQITIEEVHSRLEKFMKGKVK